jgi:antitoxin CptB
MRSNDDKDMAIRRQRALYRASYRGTREMDFLLGQFAKANVDQMDSRELVAFEQLMKIPEPVLTDALVDGGGQFEETIAQLLEHIRQFHKNKNR